MKGKASSSHTHDDRYYTETEINNKISTINNSINTLNSNLDGLRVSSYLVVSNETESEIKDWILGQVSPGIRRIRLYNDVSNYLFGEFGNFNIFLFASNINEMTGIVINHWNGNLYVIYSIENGTNIAISNLQGQINTVNSNLIDCINNNAGVIRPNHDDCNNLITPGIYGCGPETANTPYRSYGILTVRTESNDKNWVYQEYMSTDTNNYMPYYRININNSGWTDWQQIINKNDIATLQSNFQAGVNTCYNACKDRGVTPASSTPSAIYDAVGTIYQNQYNYGVRDADNRAAPGTVNYDTGYNNGYNAAHVRYFTLYISTSVSNGTAFPTRSGMTLNLSNINTISFIAQYNTCTIYIAPASDAGTAVRQAEVSASWQSFDVSNLSGDYYIMLQESVTNGTRTSICQIDIH